MLRFSLITRGPGSVWKASDALSGPGFPPAASKPLRGQRGGCCCSLGQPRGPAEGRTRGAAPTRPFAIWQSDQAAWQEPDRPRDRNVPLAVPGMGGTQPPSANWDGGFSYGSRLPFQQSGTHPHTCQGEDPRCLHWFAHSGHPDQGPTVTGPCDEPGTQWNRHLPAWSLGFSRETGSKSREGTRRCGTGRSQRRPA